MIDAIFVNLIILIGGMISGQPPDTFSPPVDFFKEEITLSVDETTATVNGVFYFHNNTDRGRPFPVVFPFYTDSVTHFPHEIKAYTIDDNDTLAINFEPLKERGAIRMAIPMKPNAITVWYLDYSQRIESSRARYILTSTSAWKKPLDEATYRFVVPKSFDVNFAWPEADSVVSGKQISLWSHRIDFMPERDMEIIWERK
ncbi:MAG: hypothetical protein V3W18_01675 [candidate division Zixibacteria bacterium]